MTWISGRHHDNYDGNYSWHFLAFHRLLYPHPSVCPIFSTLGTPIIVLKAALTCALISETFTEFWSSQPFSSLHNFDAHRFLPSRSWYCVCSFLIGIESPPVFYFRHIFYLGHFLCIYQLLCAVITLKIFNRLWLFSQIVNKPVYICLFVGYSSKRYLTKEDKPDHSSWWYFSFSLSPLET